MVIMTENPYLHTRWMQKKLGKKVYNELVNDSNFIKKWTKEELKELRVDLRIKLKSYQ